MHRRPIFGGGLIWVSSILSAVLLGGCVDESALPLSGASPGVGAEGVAERETEGASAFTALPPVPKQDPRLVALGDDLFHDKRLSDDDTVSCSTCHDISTAGMDGRVASVGIRQQVGGSNAPMVFNSSLNFVQFWDGRAATLEAQVNVPPNAAGEMGSNWQQIMLKLNSDAAIVARFEAVFSDGATEANVRSAIAAFERELLTPSPFDRYLKGDRTALSAVAQRGLKRFVDYGCVACHQGRGIGGNKHQKFGVMGDYFADRGNLKEADDGRFAVTKRESDRHVFKVPSLRNVARTAPYFHDGMTPNLPAAVRVMARYQLGRDLSVEEVDDIVAFLESLTGGFRGKSL
ncbi:MAG: c-type cytochrome [Myxococcales bacterium]|nr:c-type cytochrome [Myxococcales bacterium]